MDKKNEFNETVNKTHLTILVVYTIFSVILIVESWILQWETWPSVLMVIGIIASWSLYFTQKIPENNRLWIYVILMMITFFFYGIHESVLYDLAPGMAVMILIFSMTNVEGFVNLSLATFYITMLYNLAVTMDWNIDFDATSVSRLLMHIVIVYMAGRIAKVIINKSDYEKKDYIDRIQELEEVNRRTEDFLTNVSHELRTPINAVTGITSVMLKKVKDTGLREDILSVQKAGYRLAEQVGDILDYTEIDTGRIKISEEGYMLSSVLNDFISENQMLFQEENKEVIFDVDSNIPSLLVGDGGKIKKILRHLISNAIKFTETGGIYIHIYAIRKSYGINLCIQVKDTGIGMDAEEIERITERFYQVNSGRSRKVGGLGMGLSIVYGLTKAMRGFMRIDSEKGRGTTVQISIPQHVIDSSPCMEVKNRTALNVGCLFQPERYENPEVREYYNEMIENMVTGLNISLHRVSDIHDLEKLQRIYRLTHLFIGKEEYVENTGYFDSLEESMEVIVIADASFTLEANSQIKILRKPFFCFPVMNIMNAGEERTIDYMGKRMLCKDVQALVVDDEVMNLVVAEGIFKDYGMTVKTVTSGMQAIAQCEKEDFDIIFLDHMMPVMDGVETIKHIRKLEQDLGKQFNVVALTANAVSGAKEMFLEEGFDGFVSKPIEYTELERVLRKVLPKSSIYFVDEEELQTGGDRENKAIADAGVSDKKTDVSGEKADALHYLSKRGINTVEGIKYCRNDKAFYIELITKFAKDAEAKGKEISEYYEKEDFENYRIRVHALKSTARTIGAETLSELARDAEEAAKRGDFSYIHDHQEELMWKYATDVQNILDAVGVSEQSPQEGREALSKEELLERLHELEKSMETFEADKAESMIKELAAYHYQNRAISKLLEKVEYDVTEFDLKSAVEKVNRIIEEVS